MMDEIKMIDEEIANTDKLLFYCSEKIEVHIILKREISLGKKSFLNGFIVERLNERLWLFQDRVIGKIRLSISEIAPWGVKEFKEVGA